MSTYRKELESLCAELRSAHGIDCATQGGSDGWISAIVIEGKEFPPVAAAEYMREKLWQRRSLPRGKARATISWLEAT